MLLVLTDIFQIDLTVFSKQASIPRAISSVPELPPTSSDSPPETRSFEFMNYDEPGHFGEFN